MFYDEAVQYIYVDLLFLFHPPGFVMLLKKLNLKKRENGLNENLSHEFFPFKMVNQC